MIYREKRGNKDVKEYKVPYNPKTEEQGKQRDYLKNAVLAWKIDGYSDPDIKAWNIYANIQKKNLSGYNIFLRERINTEKESKTWNKLTNCNIYDVYAEKFKVDINVESDLSGKLYIGTSKYSMLKEFTGVFSVDKYTFAITGLSKKTEYYFYIKNTSVGESGRTGIYRIKTTLLMPVIIDIGQPAIDRNDTWTTNTLVVQSNPANASGIIDTIEIWCNVDLTGTVQVASFFVVSGNNLSTRDYVTLNSVSSGAKRVITQDKNGDPIALNVEAGDYIGIYFQYGKMEQTDPDSGKNTWQKYGDQIPCVNIAFANYGDKSISLYGTGE